MHRWCQRMAVICAIHRGKGNAMIIIDFKLLPRIRNVWEVRLSQSHSFILSPLTFILAFEVLVSTITYLTLKLRSMLYREVRLLG